MGKAPAFQFYVKDWLSSPDLRMASPSTRGIWIDLLCYMWEAKDKGEVEGTQREFLKLTGASDGELKLFFEEAKRYGFCDVFVTHNGSITVVNRRMSREERFKKSNRLRQQRFRDNKKVTDDCNAEITHTSSTPSPSAKNKNITSNLKFDDFWKEYPKKIGKKPCLKKWKARKLDQIAERIISDVKERKAKDRQWLKGYIPNPETYINQDRWEDPIQADESQQQAAPAVKKKSNGARCGTCHEFCRDGGCFDRKITDKSCNRHAFDPNAMARALRKKEAS